MKRILVVDDDADIRELVQLVLEREGHEIDCVDRGRAALERLAGAAYDLVICDLNLPDIDGVAVHRAMARQPAPRPAMLFLTGYADTSRYEDFLRGAGAPVMAKPFEIAALRETVRRLLGSA